MNLKDRETYEETGMCLEHNLEEAVPFRTIEGTHKFRVCRTCKEAVVNYKGEKHRGKVSELLRFISHQGIKYENGDIDLFGDVEVPNLFE